MSSSTRIVPAFPGFFHEGKPVLAWAISPNFAGNFDAPEWLVTPIVNPAPLRVTIVNNEKRYEV